jgi:hypothetical protein
MSTQESNRITLTIRIFLMYMNVKVDEDKPN